MISRQQCLWLALFLAVAATALVSMRTAHRAAYWRRHADEPVRSWMTVGYIAHSYHVPPPALEQALGLPPHEKRPLAVLARSQHRDVNQLIAEVRLALLKVRARP